MSFLLIFVASEEFQLVINKVLSVHILGDIKILGAFSCRAYLLGYCCASMLFGSGD